MRFLFSRAAFNLMEMGFFCIIMNKYVHQQSLKAGKDHSLDPSPPFFNLVQSNVLYYAHPLFSSLLFFMYT